MVELKKPKKSFRKIWLIPIFCIFILLLVLALLETFIDLNRYRESLASRLSQATGWHVQMESLSLDFTHGLGVECGGLHIRSKDESHDLLFAEKMYLLAELRPLLKKQIKIKKATIVQPVVKIYSESPAQELSSIPDPQDTSESQQVPGKHSESPTLGLPPVPDSKEPVEDQRPEKPSDKHMVIKKFKENLNKTDLRLEIVEIRQGKIFLIDPSSKSSSSHDVPMDVSLRLELKRASQKRVDAVIDSLELGFNDLLFRGTFHVEDLLASKARVKADLKSDAITVIEIRKIEKLITDFKFPEELEKGKIEHISIHLNAPLQTMDNLDALKQEARLDFDFKIKDAVYLNNDWNIPLPQLIGEGTWENNLLSQQFHGDIFGGKFQEQGIVQFSKSAEGGNILTIDSDVTFAGLDFSKAKSPGIEVWLPLQGKTAGSFKIKGPVTLFEKGTEFHRLNWNGTVAGENLVFKIQDSMQNQVANATFYIKKETPALANLEVELEKIKIKDIPFKKAQGIFHIKPNTVQLVDGKIWPQNGEIQLAGNYNLQEKNYVLDIKGEKLRAKDFFRLDEPATPEVPINVSLRLETKRVGPKRMDAVVDPLRVGIEDLLFHGTIRVEDLLASKSYVKADLKSGRTSFSRIRQMENVFQSFKVPKELEKGNIQNISFHLDAPLPTRGTLDVLKQKARLEFALKIKDAVYRKNEWNILLPRLIGEGTWENNLLTQKFHGEIFGGQFQEKGIVRFSNNPQGVRTFFLDSEATLSGLDLTLLNYPRKEDWIPSQGKAAGSFKIKGPVTLSEKRAEFDHLHWNGTFKGQNLVLESQDSLRQAASVNVIIKEGTPALTPLEVHFDQLKIQDIPFKRAKGIFHVKPEALELIKGTIWPEHGELQLAGTYSMNHEIYSLEIQGKNLRTEDFSKNALNGPASFSGDFKGRMTPEKSSKKTGYAHFTHGLSGTFHIDTSNGTIQELGDLETLLTVLNLTTSVGKKENGIEYKYIGGDFKILKGLLATDNFIIDGPQLKMLVVGKAGLPDGKVDAEITAMPLQMLDSVVQLVPGFGEILTGGKKGGLLVTHCQVTGTLENPEFKLQPHKSATKKPTDIFKGITNLPNWLLNSK